MGGGGKGGGGGKNQSEAERIKLLEAELSRLNQAQETSSQDGESRLHSVWYLKLTGEPLSSGSNGNGHNYESDGEEGYEGAYSEEEG